MGAAALALLIANSPLAPSYHALLDTYLGPLTIHYWIADALMAIFFLLVGLEVKREWYDGALATPALRRLPIIAAIAGMAVPAVVYLTITGGDAALVRGWAIPTATDIAFAMGVVSGIVMSYQFGTNWSVFSDKAGPVIGPLMAYEVLTAFFLEAGFLGVMLFGMEKVGKKPEDVIVEKNEAHGFRDLQNNVNLYTKMLAFFSR